ncbi:alkaline phosphatase family protein [Chitinophaga filiformis]|uniref:alkaline phosphatase family protein n=1 Tax=Chitinophaga filiformis TaxID=104663 RepID=UPI001F3D21F8|nr:alkaline phosphatase family protein [Chitinophaga filiformis]MCF6404687.1 alkaline phosphatase family protein [Chitinophaga filiformis]
MKKGIVLFILSLLGTGAFAQQAQHVVLITIDGFRPDFYMDTSWHAVHLQEMAKKGVYAKGVNSVFPSMTYPSHTTIVTGVWPVKHGVYYNNMFNPNGPANKNYWNDTAIKAPTIWKVAQQKGMKVAALLWPVSADAPVMYNIPDIGGMGEAVREQYSKPANFIADLKKDVFNNATRIEYGKDHNIAGIASYVIKKDQPNLMTIHFFSVDHYQHEQGRQGDLVKAAVADADSSVGIIIDALKAAGIWEKTVLIVTGDHGFLDVKTSVNPNIWLVKAGLITDVKKDDWKAQFYSVGGSSYLYLKDKNDSKTLNQVKDILANLPAEEKKLFRIIDRKQLDKVGGNPEVAFALSGENGASFGNAMTGEAIKPGHGGSHGYYPDFTEIRTGFVACGPGVKEGGVIPEMNLRDIAPALAKILGLSLPTAEGKIPAGLLTK